MKNIRQSRYFRRAALISIFVLLSASVFGQSKKTKRAVVNKEQTSFSSEGKISRLVKLPRTILKQLAEYDDGQLAKCQKDEFTRKARVASHFAASKINLNNDKLEDFIIQAQTLCFMGAHNTTFWIFTAKGKNSALNYQLTFDITVDYLEVLKTSANGYRDIETASHTAVELYTIRWKFDGQKYQKSECRLTDENNKVSKINCEF